MSAAPTIRGQSNMLLKRLLRRCNTHYSKVVKGPTTRSETPVKGEAVLQSESRIDSHVQPESDDRAVISLSPAMIGLKLVTATEALSSPSPSLTPPPSSSSALTIDDVVTNPMPIPKASGTKVRSVMSLLRKGASQQAFHEKLFASSLATSTSITTTHVIEVNPASTVSTILATDLIDMNDLITSSEGVTSDMIAEGDLVTEVIFSSAKEESSPSSLMSLASSIPSFLHHFTTTSFVNKASLRKITDEEGIDKAQTHILEGLHWMNEVSLCNNARMVATAARDMEFDKLSDCMDKLRSSYQEELHLLNHDLQLKLDETSARDASLAKDLEEVTQQLAGLKTIFSEKVSTMYIACSEKDVSARQLEDEVSILQLSLREK
ncbi:unnamed protein product [Lactuca virosa]|uniref:Uncharacterized protein n=1 Tax=Lactuca virosa TaxID=75947 RepID=A0AAU9N322_9ASTR|nr:unnamed protein product [Lactuca virosa]